MKKDCSITPGVGETLPLFGRETHAHIKAPVQNKMLIQRTSKVRPISETRLEHPLSGGDRHMRAAWELSRALKAAKSGHKSGRRIARMSPNQRHQVGSAICEHLLASLREQVSQEQSCRT